MKYFIRSRPQILFAACLSGLVLSWASILLSEALMSQAHAQPNAGPPASQTNDAATDLRTLGERMPDQAHVMADVGYHFANLWFAADKQNWPLAGYYLNQTRSHLRWAVRIHSVRKISTGAEIDLNGILDAVDNSYLSEIGNAITNKDGAKFNVAYRQTLEGCYACHKACEKPFLRPQVPNAAGGSIINFDPNTTWPQ
jgi:hypothetical protein